MTEPFKTWTVLPHGKLSKVDEDLLTVVGEIDMPIGHFPRRMTVVRLKDGRLVVFNAIALDEKEMTALESYGVLAFLIVPSSRHRLDAPIWKQRYPAMKVIAPAGSREKVGEVVAVDAVTADFGDPSVRLVTVSGTHEAEAALEIDRPDGVTLVVNDIIGNIHGEKGFGGWALRLMQFAGDEPHVPRPVKAGVDKPALAAHLRRWADLPNLKRVLVSHGSPIEDDPAGVLRKLAESLA
jgi:hypothetical protein